jgi:hypothetical protein
MRQSRRLALCLSLPLLLAVAGCAGRASRDLSPAGRFAATLESADPAVDASIAVMDGFERRALREESAVAFALGRGAPPGRQPEAPLPTAVAGAAGEVIAPAFTALGDYAHLLAAAAEGEALDPRPSPGPEALSQAVAQALPRTSARIAPPVAEAGVAGVATLARLAQETRGRPGVQALAQQAQPALGAVTALLKAVIGTQPDAATRGVVQARREGMAAAHVRLLQAAQRDPALGVAGRYALYHQLSAMRDEDPVPGTLAAIITLLSAMEEAHAAIAAGDPAAAEKAAGFEAALAELTALTGQDQTPAEAE